MLRALLAMGPLVCACAGAPEPADPTDTGGDPCDDTAPCGWLELDPTASSWVRLEARNGALVPRTLSLGDLNGDGFQDLALAGVSGDVGLVYGPLPDEGGAVAADDLVLPAQAPPVVADLNGDGIADLATQRVDTQRDVVLFTGPILAPDAAPYTTIGPWPTGQAPTLFGADVDGDEIVELVAVTPGRGADPTEVLVVNGSLIPGVFGRESGAFTLVDLSPGIGELAAVAQMDGDPFADVYLSGSDGAVYLAMANARWDERPVHTAGEALVGLATVTDADSDGYEDLAIATDTRIRLIDGPAPTVDKETAVFDCVGVQGVSGAGDADGDGRGDLFVHIGGVTGEVPRQWLFYGPFSGTVACVGDVSLGIAEEGDGEPWGIPDLDGDRRSEMFVSADGPLAPTAWLLRGGRDGFE